MEAAGPQGLLLLAVTAPWDLPDSGRERSPCGFPTCSIYGLRVAGPRNVRAIFFPTPRITIDSAVEMQLGARGSVG